MAVNLPQSQICTCLAAVTPDGTAASVGQGSSVSGDFALNVRRGSGYFMKGTTAVVQNTAEFSGNKNAFFIFRLKCKG